MRLIIIFTGSILLFLGFISLLTPIPGGTLAITLGAGMIICASKTATEYIKRNRARHHRFNRSITWHENKMGSRLSRPLRMTRPGEEQLPSDGCGSE